MLDAYLTHANSSDPHGDDEIIRSVTRRPTSEWDREHFRPLRFPDLSGALCVQQQDYEFSGVSNGRFWYKAQDRMRKICAACPARVNCLALGLERTEWPGIYGGANQRERKQLLAARKAAA